MIESDRFPVRKHHAGSGGGQDTLRTCLILFCPGRNRRKVLRCFGGMICHNPGSSSHLVQIPRDTFLPLFIPPLRSGFRLLAQQRNIDESLRYGIWHILRTTRKELPWGSTEPSGFTEIQKARRRLQRFIGRFRCGMDSWLTREGGLLANAVLRNQVVTDKVEGNVLARVLGIRSQGME